MIGFKQFLEEVRSSNVLYHATRMEFLYRMIRDGEIKSVTEHHTHQVIHTMPYKKGRERDKTKGVSLSRDFDFAKKHYNNEVILVLDREKLKTRFKMRPVQFWDNTGEARVPYNKISKVLQNEFEEFVITEKGIPFKYVEKIFARSVNDGDAGTVRSALDAAGLEHIEVVKFKL